jgi:hypothetical protein
VRDFRATKATDNVKKCRCYNCPFGSNVEPDANGDVWCGVATKVADRDFDAGFVRAYAGDFRSCGRFTEHPDARLYI